MAVTSSLACANRKTARLSPPFLPNRMHNRTSVGTAHWVIIGIIRMYVVIIVRKFVAANQLKYEQLTQQSLRRLFISSTPTNLINLNSDTWHALCFSAVSLPYITFYFCAIWVLQTSHVWIISLLGGGGVLVDLVDRSACLLPFNIIYSTGIVERKSRLITSHSPLLRRYRYICMA